MIDMPQISCHSIHLHQYYAFSYKISSELSDKNALHLMKKEDYEIGPDIEQKVTAISECAEN